ncbi:hypothetical protein [Pseudonocardia aurantiaca]|uniref:Anti-sigma-D factor RsdA sigma factor binding region domain-containing protein n=1 Tax=Pseudonocardia aurantiaca TaxID=75290 RepID=A0ABW4FJU5_9PSEU
MGPKVREPLLSDTERPVDLAALRADDALVEELAAGRMARVGAPARGTEDELVAMLAAWVADVRPAAAAHPLPDAPASPGAVLPSTEHREPAPASVTPRGVPKHRAPNPYPYGRRLAVAAALVVLGTSGLAIGASNAQPGEVLWPVSRVFYAERARSVEAAHEVNSNLEHARTALREGRSADAAQAIANAAAHLPQVRPAEGHAELARAQQLLLDALGTPDNVTGDPAPGTGTPTSPEAHVPDLVVPGGIHSPGEGARTPDESVYASPETGSATAAQPAAPGSADHLAPSAPAAAESSGAPADQPSTGGAPSTEAPVSSPTDDTPSSGTPSTRSDTPSSESPSGTSDGQTPGGQTEPDQPGASDPASPDSSQPPPSGEPNSQQSPDNPPSETQSEPQEQPPAEGSPPPAAANEPSTPSTGGRPEQQQQDQSPPAADSQNFLPDEPANQPPANGDPGGPAESTNDQPAGAGSTDNGGSGTGSGSDSGRSSGSGSSNDDSGSSSKDRGGSNNDNSSSSKDRGSSNDDNSSSSKDRGSSNNDNSSSSKDGGGAKSLISSVKDLVGSLTKKD